jgi:hypothetical protein
MAHKSPPKFRIAEPTTTLGPLRGMSEPATRTVERSPYILWSQITWFALVRKVS